MKILFHGAINLSNFGDFLFAKIFYDYAKENGYEAEFYAHPKFGISEFFCEHLGYKPPVGDFRKSMDECDALVFIPGGYLRESSKKDILSKVRHIKRYFLPALYFMKKNKPIYILGVGAGPFNNTSLYSRLALKIMNYAKVIFVRNEESKQYCLKLGVTTDVKVTADTALVIKDYMKSECGHCKPFEKKAGEKAILLHVNGDKNTRRKMIENVVPAIETFIKAHPEYKLYLAADGQKMEKAYEEYASRLDMFKPIRFEYEDPMQLCQQLSQMDVVVTPKLHVGIVSCVLGRSVLSFPAVPQKTQRFYRQIGETDRCIPLDEVSVEKVYALLEEKMGKFISVPKVLIDKAYENLIAFPPKEGNF